MKLAELAAKPQLMKLTVDDPRIVEKYGEEIEFYVKDRQDMDTFMALAKLDQENFADIAVLVQKMILDEEGNPVISDEKTLPVDIMVKVIEKVVFNLGNGIVQTTAA